MTARSWIGTLNNPTVDARDFLEKWNMTGGARYVTGQLEKGVEGTVHIQYFLNFENAVRISHLKKHCSKSHFEKIKVDNGAATYCNKEDTRLDGPWEFGTKPVKRNSKTDWEEVKKNAQEGKLDKIPADIYVKHYSTLKLIAKDHMVHNPVSEEKKCMWYFGKAGAGKSRRAFEQFPTAYRKMANKWWDGYQNQDSVILDDLGPDHKVLGHHLKIWADRYPFIGESKGGAIMPCYKNFIVTSQYHPCEIWEDEPTRMAILRRFEVVEIHRTVQQALMEGAA